VPLVDEGLLGGAVVHEHHVGVAAAPNVEGLAGPHRHDPDGNPGAGRESRQEVVEEPGLLRRGGGGDGDRALGRGSRRGHEKQGRGDGERAHRRTIATAARSRRHDAPSSPKVSTSRGGVAAASLDSSQPALAA
jgi:hypothetical protein